MRKIYTTTFLLGLLLLENLLIHSFQTANATPKTVPPQSTLTELYAKADDYATAWPDSLRKIAGLVMQEGKRLNDKNALVRGQRYEAQALWRLGSHDKAMQMAIKALSDAEKWKTTSELPDIYGVIGNLHKEKANYSMALAAVAKGMGIARSRRDTVGIIYMARLQAMFTQGLGADRRDSILIDKSLDMHLEGLKLAESSPRFEKHTIGYYNNLAQVYVKKKDPEKALFYVTKGMNLAKKHNQLLSLTYSYTWLSQIWLMREDKKKAIGYLESALKITQELHNPFREMEVNRYLYRALSQTSNYKEALAAYTRYSEIRDSLRVLENVRQIGEVQMKYEADKKDQQIGALGAANRSKTREIVWALGGLLAFLLLSVFMFFQYRTISRTNKVLAKNNQKINDQAEKLTVLMKELHHRVKNNLQTVSSLLSLQSSRITDEDARQSIRAGQQRIEAMSLIHKSLYNDDTVNLVNMREYMCNLIESVMQSFGISHEQLKLSISVSVREMDIDTAMPIGLIVNEWITNSFKHAFKHTSDPEISVILENRGNLYLEISDNGVGMDLKKWESPAGSFGVKVVKVLSRQLDGKCKVQIAGGTKFIMEAPLRQRSTDG
ncbi:hypothetical protein DYBT9623_01461 [Dyadobacter sp. CECT 9623]|uniref:histidine kinase n=1 Tax=Dyadobacter linearis TaxID=2823330 RepID=A0ABM8UMM0_9BACT|nr:histidine kinase dimerization/phosphoacceptor domain -containing protein [Dyadobacter sp. CECT 9623]CAG5068729.1 hypothetical protein DYBT9623_01461 [Dyadobacter sp. CECT 9623]